MIDFHTHFLPCVDDGSKSAEESISMLNALAEQGVKTVIATPHFNANDETVDEFIQRRNEAYESLKDRVPDTLNVVLGAEVRYYDGISHQQDIKKLRVEGTKLLMIEMPFRHWSEFELNELIDLASRGKITPVIAHIERYISIVKRETIIKLVNNGVLFQANASFFDGLINMPKAIKMLKQNQIHFIGSDCHNMAERQPNIIKAIYAIKKKLGNSSAEDYLNYQNELFRQNKLI